VDDPTNSSSSPSGTPPASGAPSPSPNGAAAPSASATPSETPPKATRPDYLPDTFWDGDKGAIKPEFGQHFRDLTAFKAAEDSRRLTLPAKPEDYKLGLPKDFTAPQGIEFVPDENDPILPQARAFAQKNGLSQDAFHELVALHAAGQIGMQQRLKDFETAEVGKLGVNGTARKTAVDTWLKATLGDELGGHFAATLKTASHVAGIEKLMGIVRTQGAVGHDGNSRVPGSDDRKLSDDEYSKLSFAEKQAYARKHSQPAAVNGAAGR
jgi:hypothetical protein